MTISSALIGFSLAATLLSITPGIDTALVLRTAAVENTRRAMLAGAGVVVGVLVWGLAAAFGLGALLAVSDWAYRSLRFAGAAYLIWLGVRMWRSALDPSTASGLTGMKDSTVGLRSISPTNIRWFGRGLMTNLLNPKVGVFYVSFLPQFMPAEVNVIAFSALLAGIHAAISLLWFALLTLATRPFTQALQKPAVSRTLDGITGSVLIAFGLRLALERRA